MGSPGGKDPEPDGYAPMASTQTSAGPIARSSPLNTSPGDRRTRIRFLFAHPAHMVATGLGSGLLRPAPGTWGTMFGWATYAAMAHIKALLPAAFNWGGAAFFAIAVALAAGLWSAGPTGRALGQTDASEIVIDEVVAFWLVLAMLPEGAGWRLQLIAFALFRAFDIVKPAPIRQIDRRWRNPFGVMADDLVAAFYTLLAIAIGVRVQAWINGTS
jgi:phosphatidylglycerophosphatase A